MKKSGKIRNSMVWKSAEATIPNKSYITFMNSTSRHRINDLCTQHMAQVRCTWRRTSVHRWLDHDFQFDSAGWFGFGKRTFGRQCLEPSKPLEAFKISFTCWPRHFKHVKGSSVQLSSTWTNHVWHRNAWSDYQVLPMVVWLMFCFFPGRVCKRQSPSCNKLHKEHGDFDSQAHFHCSDFEPCLHNSMSSCGSGPWTC